MHLAAGIWINGRDMRLNKDLKIEIQGINGEKLIKSLRYNN